MRTSEVLWFFLWRMTLWGLGLGLGLGAAYGTLVGIPLFPLIHFFGPPLGAMYGTMAGLPLGLLEGAVLGVMTVVWRLGKTPGDPLRYRRAAELACVVACMLAVTLFWGFLFWRDGDLTASVRIVLSRDLPEALILVAGPLLLATGATWLVARRVAGQYMSEFYELTNRGPTRATDESSSKKVCKS